MLKHGGDCDNLGMYSGCLVNDNYHSMIYRGIENVYGDTHQPIDGLNRGGTKVCICYNPSDYVLNKYTDTYNAIGYAILSKNNNFPKSLGYDSENPLIALPDKEGGSSNTGICDSFYYNRGNYLCMGGAYYLNTQAGLFFWNCNVSSTVNDFNCGIRFIKYK